MPSLTLDIKPGSELSKKILAETRDRVLFSKNRFQARHLAWSRAEEKTLAYLKERDIDAKRRQARENEGKPQYTTIVLPYSFGMLMTAHTYWTTVFLGRSPVFQYTGRHGESEQQTQAIEALIDYQLQVGGLLPVLYVWLLDVGKYGVGIVGNYWDREESIVSEIVEEPQLIVGMVPTGRTRKKKRSRRVTGYVGNRLYNVRPYDFFPDPRVPVNRFQDGEFVAVYNELSWNTLVKRADQGFFVNIEEARRHTRGGGAMQRVPGSSQLDLADSSALFSGLDMAQTKASDVVSIYEMTIELIPSKWKLGRSDFPEKWVFTTTSDFQVVLGAQPLGAFHNKFPFQVLEFEVEGYALVNRGISEILDPVQRTMDWLINSHMYNVRKTLNNQFIVDPSRVVMKDLMEGMAGGIVRAKAEAYGTDLRGSVVQLPVVDVTQTHLRDLGVMLQVGQRAVGISDQLMGALNVTGRKTATEIRTSSTFGINRLKTEAEYFSALGWAPLAQMLVQNSQQYYDLEKKFRLVGDLATQAGPQFIDVNAETIQGFYDFVPVDGTLPVDRFAMAGLWKELLASAAQFPAVLQQYDVGKIFSWVAQLAGLKNIQQFKVQMVPDQQVQAQQQAGNIIPMQGILPPQPPAGAAAAAGGVGNVGQ